MARGAGCSWSLRGEVDIEMLDDEVECDDKSVKHDEHEDKSDEVSRVVDEERSILLLATISMIRLFTVDLGRRE